MNFEEERHAEKLLSEGWLTAEQAQNMRGKILANQDHIALLRRENVALSELNHGQFLELEYLRPIVKAAENLLYESEEYDFDDGLGKGAAQSHWDDLAGTLEPATDAIKEVLNASPLWAIRGNGGDSSSNAKPPVIVLEWIDQIATQYGTQQMAALRGDDFTARAANNWIHRIADDHWHEIIVAVRRRPLSEEMSNGTTVKP